MKIAVIESGTALHAAVAQAIEPGDALADPIAPEALRADCLAGQARLVVLNWADLTEATRENCNDLTRGPGDRPAPYLITVVDPPDPAAQLAAFEHGADAVVAGPASSELIRARLAVARRFLRREDDLRSRSAALEAARDRLAAENAALAEIAALDPLTGLGNRRAFRDALDAQWSLSRRQGLPLSLAMIDVDRFKAFNDRFGHLAGDEALRTVGALLRANVRDHDLVARFGGEEFVILLPATDEADCRHLIERLRLTVAGHPWPLRAITISLGVATLDQDESPADLIEQADRSLYLSKALGRNRVTFAREAAALIPNPTDGRLPVHVGP